MQKPSEYRDFPKPAPRRQRGRPTLPPATERKFKWVEKPPDLRDDCSLAKEAREENRVRLDMSDLEDMRKDYH